MFRGGDIKEWKRFFDEVISIDSLNWLY